MKHYRRFALLLTAALLVGSTPLAAQERDTHIHEGIVGRFDIDVWTDRGEAAVYYPGERVRVYFRPQRDSYVVVYSIDTEGYIRVLYPYDYNDDPFVYGGRTYRIPYGWDHHDLVVSGPSGIEYIVAVASLRPISVPRWPRYYDAHYEPAPDLIEHITGDPYEGMVRLNDLIIPVEHREYGFVTNSTYFYVERRVWYPRYVCYDCHWPRPLYFHPYVDVCVGFEIVIVDYDWYDDWAYWRPHHPPMRYRRGCWTVRRRDHSVPATYRSERYSRRRGFKNIGFSKTDIEPVDIEKVKKEYKRDTKFERRRGMERSAPPPRSGDSLSRDNVSSEKRYSRSRKTFESKPEGLKNRTVRTEPRTETRRYSDEAKKKTGRTSKGRRSFWDKITDWSKKSKSSSKRSPSLSKPKSKSPERRSSKPSKVSTPSKRKSTSESTKTEKHSSSKRRRK